MFVPLVFLLFTVFAKLSRTIFKSSVIESIFDLCVESSLEE